MSNGYVSALCAGIGGFFVVGGITFFADDPFMSMLCTSIPAGLISVYFESSDDAQRFAPYFVCGLALVLFYGIIYNFLLTCMYPKSAVALLIVIIAIVSCIALGLKDS